MDFISGIFLESPWRLAIVSFLLFAVVLLTRMRVASERWRRWSLPMTLLLIVAMFVTQSVVVTQRERILQRLDEFVAALEAPDTDAIADMISLNYDSEGFDRDEFLGALERWLKQIDVHDTRCRRRDVTVDGHNAELILGAMATVHRNGGTGQDHWGRWRMGWVEEGGTWRIRSIRIEMFDAMEISQMRGFLP
ncbi:MAG TPA: hypothetical protein P5081_02560 [Phycisphaerae bacterium]|nr:hypothetical protein [Phycisphaerae bacterium]HRW51739.1 hypothetical protein [Phycisphaerae bacterium]